MSRKIWGYEARRILTARVYTFVLFVTALYALFLIKNDVLRGTGGTAPFSQWSFCAYLLALSPLLCAIVLFYVGQLFGKTERDANTLMRAAPFSQSRYLLLKVLAILAAWLLAMLVVCAVCFAFYGAVFGYYAYGRLAVCVLLVSVPQFAFFTGTGLWLGRVRGNLCYVLLAALFFVAMVKPVPPAMLDPIGFSLLAPALRAIPDKGVIPFVIPPVFLASRAIFVLLGAGLIWLACARLPKSSVR